MSLYDVEKEYWEMERIRDYGNTLLVALTDLGFTSVEMWIKALLENEWFRHSEIYFLFCYLNMFPENWIVDGSVLSFQSAITLARDELVDYFEKNKVRLITALRERTSE